MLLCSGYVRRVAVNLLKGRLRTVSVWTVGCLFGCLCVQPDLCGQVTLAADAPGSNLGGWTMIGSDEFEVAIRKDSHAETYGWYSFFVYGGRGRRLTIHIRNAGGSNAAQAWSYNQPVVSSDWGASWRRIQNTSYENGVFSFVVVAESDSLWIAHNPVYSFSRWLSLVSRISDHPAVNSVNVIGKSVEGRPIHCVQIGGNSSPSVNQPAVWILARQHPAEVGGSWMLEGLLDYLLSDETAAFALLLNVDVFVVGFMNPDGFVHGNYRVNSQGIELASSWSNPDSLVPSVTAVEHRMMQYRAEGGRIDMLLDLHSHSTARANFAYYHSARATSPSQHEDAVSFLETLARINRGFTFERSIPVEAAFSSAATGWVYRQFGAHGITIESSYQDITYGPLVGQYMTKERMKALGRSIVDALLEYYSGKTERL